MACVYATMVFDLEFHQAGGINIRLAVVNFVRFLLESCAEVGDKGITWRVSRIVSTKKDYALLSTDLVVTRFSEVKFFKVQGTCSVTPTVFKCITIDGRFQSYATGIIQGGI